MDTHVVFWAVDRPELLSPKASKALVDADELYVSVINLWEMILKKGNPRELIVDPFAWWGKYISKEGLLTLSIIPAHVKALDGLSKHHGDPFDRMLIAQCVSEELTLVSKDRKLAAYGVPVIW
jgi:PIN domain nuclease of toxin-antitoxin system